MAWTTDDAGNRREIVERYVVMAGMPTSFSAPYGLKAAIRADDAEAREDLKARGFRYVASERAWLFPGRKADCAAEMARLVNECGYSIPGGRQLVGSVPSLTKEIAALAVIDMQPVYPNPLFS